MTHRYASDHPVRTALLCVGFQFLVTWLILALGKSFAPAPLFGKIKLLAFASTVVVPLAMVRVLGLWKEIGLGLDRIRFDLAFALALLPCAVYLLAGIHTEGQQPASDLLIQFFNAFGEELLFRGVIFVLLLSLPRWQAIMLCGVLFGSMHLMHVFMGMPWEDALRRAVLTTITGTMFTAVRFRCGSLWLVVLLHMVVNLCKLYSEARYAASGSPLEYVVWFEYAFQVALVAWIVFSERGTLRWSAATQPMAARDGAPVIQQA